MEDLVYDCLTHIRLVSVSVLAYSVLDQLDCCDQRQGCLLPDFPFAPRTLTDSAKISLAKLFRLGAPSFLAADPHRGETRYRAMGRNTLGRPLFVVFTLRRIGGGLIIRPISARYAHEKEATRWPAN